MIIAATGHRPGRLECGHDENHPWLFSIKEELTEWLFSQKSKLSYCITGMAMGGDTWFAETAIELSIPLHAYVPFPDQEARWSNEHRNRYDGIIRHCDEVLLCSQEYYPDCFLKRDRMMVDSADHIAALLSPLANHGGTHYTVRYAEKKRKPVTNFWR
jgi:uncharacterized phage-like protein YoqJ